MAAPVQPLLPQAPTQAIAAPVAAPMASMPAAPQRNPGRRGQVIVITCPKGGVGKTSLAHNLAAYHALSCPDRRILVFDGNPQQADANNLLSGWEDGVRNVTDILKDTAFNNISLNEETVMRYVTDRREAFGFDVMFGPRESQDSDPMFVNAAFMKDVLEKLRPHYDAIFVDTPVANPHEPMINDFALKVADYLLVTWGPSDSESINAERWIENVITSDPLVNGRESFPQDRVGVVINRWREGTNFNIDEARRGIATVNWLGLVPDHVAWIAAQNSSTLIARYNIQEFNEAFARILGSVTGEPIYASGAPVQAAPQNEGISGRFRRFLRGT
ncbi:MAG: ParA family protein [Actinomycetia bacterium]|nr:ParA family protein [Actinomycetes bacterium]